MRVKGKLSILRQAYFDNEITNGDSGAAKTLDWTNGNKQVITLTGSPDCTLTLTPPSGPCNLILRLIQGAGGSKTITWPGTVLWAGRTIPTLTTTAAYEDVVSFYYNGTNYYGVLSTNFG